ncbi:MAG: diacylglycerol kinase family lipid kinase [Lachnospiraceae bacterium]|jgi:YegS/Rv2252/BmrU family lipid kinase|nr:diacylglycerol kinase family lipid kinase [Lachnospiraceae bacterium]
MYHFIVNPNARTGKGRLIWNKLQTELDAAGIEYSVYFTEHTYHATEIVKSLTYDTILRKIIVVGGDGTMNEVINGIVNLDSVILGYIPAGSSNDLARSLGISSNPMTALNDILNPKYYTMMDIGELTYGNNKRRFDVSAGMGFDAAVCHMADKSKLKNKLNKIGLGKLTYFGIAIKQLFLRKPFKMTLTLDDVRKVTFNKVVFFAAHNHKYEGGGFMFCPKALMNDGMLDVIVADSIAPLRIAMLLPKAMKGKHVNARGIHIYRAARIDVVAASKEPVHMDGESGFFQTHISARCLEKRIKIITPREFN